jgi:hypothetical protein
MKALLVSLAALVGFISSGMSTTPLLAGQQTCSKIEPAIRAQSRAKTTDYSAGVKVPMTLTHFGYRKS